MEPDEYEVEKILGERVFKGQTQYKVRWAGYGPDNDTWEPTENLESCKDLLDAYVERLVRHAEKKSATLNKKDGKSKKHQTKRKGTCVLLSSSDEDADTVKDKFWLMLEKGQIPLPEHDLYTNVKSCSRTSLPLSLNEGDDGSDDIDCSDEDDESEDESCCVRRHQSASKARCHKETRRKMWPRGRKNIFAAVQSHSKHKALKISGKDGKSSASTASANHAIASVRDTHHSSELNITSNGSLVKSSGGQKPVKSVPSLDPVEKKSAASLSNAQKAEHLDPRKDRYSSRSHGVPKLNCSEFARMIQGPDSMLKKFKKLTSAIPMSPKVKQSGGGETVQSLKSESKSTPLDPSLTKTEAFKEALLPKRLPIFTGDRLVYDTDASDSTESLAAVAANTLDTEHGLTTCRRDRSLENMIVEDSETKQPKAFGETHSADQLRQKNMTFSGEKGDGEGRIGKHLALSGKHSQSKEVPGGRSHGRKAESSHKKHHSKDSSRRSEDSHGKPKADYEKRWVVKKDKSSHSLTRSDNDGANKLILKCVESHSTSKEKRRSSKPNESNNDVDMPLLHRYSPLSVDQSKHSRPDGKCKEKHSSGDGRTISKPAHHDSGVSSFGTRSGKTDNKDLHVRPSSNQSSSKIQADHRPSSSHSSSKMHAGHRPSSNRSSSKIQAIHRPSSSHSSSKIQAVNEDATKMLDMVKTTVHVKSSKDAHQNKNAENRKEAASKDATKKVDTVKDTMIVEPSIETDQRQDTENRKESACKDTTKPSIDQREDAENRMEVVDKDATKTLDMVKTSMDVEPSMDTDQRQDVTRVPSENTIRSETCEEKTDAVCKGFDLTESDKYQQPKLMSIRNYRIPKKSVGLGALTPQSQNANNARVSSRCESLPKNIETLQKKPAAECRGQDLTDSNEYQQSKLMSFAQFRVQKKSNILGNEASKHASLLKKNFDEAGFLERYSPSLKRFRAESYFPAPSIDSAGYRNVEAAAAETLQLKERSADAQEGEVVDSNDACHVAGEPIKALVQPNHGIRKFMSHWPETYGYSGYVQRMGDDRTSALRSVPLKEVQGNEVPDDTLARQSIIPVAHCAKERVKVTADCDQRAAVQDVSFKKDEFAVQHLPSSVMKASPTGILTLKNLASAAQPQPKCAVQVIKTEDNAQTFHDTAERVGLSRDLLAAEVVQRDELQAVENVGKDVAMRNEEPCVSFLQNDEEVVAGCERSVQGSSLEKDIAFSIVKTNTNVQPEFERRCETDAIIQGRVQEVVRTDTSESVEVITKCLSTVNISRPQSVDTFIPETNKQTVSTEMIPLPWIKLEKNVGAEELEMLLCKDTEAKGLADAFAHGTGRVGDGQHGCRRAEESEVREDLIAGMDLSDCVYNLNAPSSVVCKQEMAELCSEEQADSLQLPLWSEMQNGGIMPVNKEELCCRNISQNSMDSLDEKNAIVEKINEFNELLEDLFLESHSNTLAQEHARTLQTSNGEESAKEIQELLASVCQRDASEEDIDMHRNTLVLNSIVCKSEITEGPETDSHNLTDRIAELCFDKGSLGNMYCDVQETGNAIVWPEHALQGNLSENNAVVRQSSSSLSQDNSTENRSEIGRTCFTPEYMDLLDLVRPEENELQLSMAAYEKNYFPEGIDRLESYEAEEVGKHLDRCTEYVNKDNRNLDENQARQEMDSGGNPVTASRNYVAVNADVTEMPFEETSWRNASVRERGNVFIALPDQINAANPSEAPFRKSSDVLKTADIKHGVMLRAVESKACETIVKRMTDILKTPVKENANLQKVPVEDHMTSLKPSDKQNVTAHKSPARYGGTPVKTAEARLKGILKTSVKENKAELGGSSRDMGEDFGEICQKGVIKLHGGNVCEMNPELCEGNACSAEHRSNVSEETMDATYWNVSAGKQSTPDPAAIRIGRINKDSSDGLPKHWIPGNDASLEMEVEPIYQEVRTGMLPENLSGMVDDNMRVVVEENGAFEKQPGARHVLFGKSGSLAKTETDLRRSGVTVVKTVRKSPPKIQENPAKKFNHSSTHFTIEESLHLAGKQRAGSGNNSPLVQQGDNANTLGESAYTLRETLKEKFMEGMAKDGIQGLRCLRKSQSSRVSSPHEASVPSRKDFTADEIELESMAVASSPLSTRATWNSEPPSSKGSLNSPAVQSSPSEIMFRAADSGNVRSHREPSSSTSNAANGSADRHPKLTLAALGLDIRNLKRVVPPSLLPNLTSEELGQAVFKNDAKLVQFALEREGAVWDLEQRDESGQTLVMAAVRNGNNFLLRLLVQRGALVNAKKQDGTTPLMIAAQQGFAKIVGLLLSMGARIDDRTCDGETALVKAARLGHGDVIRTLLDNGANFSPIKAGGVTISEVLQGYEALRTFVLMHIHNLELDFDFRASTIIKNAGILVRSLFPLQCLTVRDMKCFSMSFNLDSLQPPSNSSGMLLFIGHAFINYQSMRCLLKMDEYAVTNVTVNGHRQRCVEQGDAYCWTLVPLCQGVNYLSVHLQSCPDPKVKLVMRAYQVMSLEL